MKMVYSEQKSLLEKYIDFQADKTKQSYTQFEKNNFDVSDKGNFNQ